MIHQDYQCGIGTWGIREEIILEVCGLTRSDKSDVFHSLICKLSSSHDLTLEDINTAFWEETVSLLN